MKELEKLTLSATKTKSLRISSKYACEWIHLMSKMLFGGETTGDVFDVFVNWVRRCNIESRHVTLLFNRRSDRIECSRTAQ